MLLLMLVETGIAGGDGADDLLPPILPDQRPSRAQPGWAAASLSCLPPVMAHDDHCTRSWHLVVFAEMRFVLAGNIAACQIWWS